MYLSFLFHRDINQEYVTFPFYLKLKDIDLLDWHDKVDNNPQV